ncbi:hypothetical protein WLX37_24770, partial [Bordetella bronchiseptica]
KLDPVKYGAQATQVSLSPDADMLAAARAGLTRNQRAVLDGALWVAGRGRRPLRPATASPAVSPPGADEHAPVRHAGVMLALHVDGVQAERTLALLRDAGGQDLERAQGRWVDGKWEDFDPLQPPQLAAGG